MRVRISYSERLFVEASNAVGYYCFNSNVMSYSGGNNVDIEIVLYWNRSTRDRAAKVGARLQVSIDNALEASP